MNPSECSQILVVDDRKDNLFIIEEIISVYLSECRIHIAQGGFQGLEVAKTLRPDVILSDVHMPDLDGIELCRLLKGDPSTRHIPIVLMTAHQTDAQIRIQGLDAGADDFILKPVDNAELVARLKVMLRIKKVEDTLREEKDSLSRKVSTKSQELGKMERRYWTLFNDVSDAIFIHTLDGFFLEVNQEATRLLGYSRQEFKKLSPGAIESSKSRCRYQGRAIQLIPGERVSTETILISKTGREIPVEINSRLIQDREKPAVLSVVRDVTDRKRIEREKNQLEEKLRQAQKMEAIGTLSGGIAHDFNNLLQVIQGYTQILLFDKTELEPEYHELKQILNASNRAAHLVQQLLTFSRKNEANLHPVNLNQEIRKAEEILIRTIPKMILIELDLEQNLWPITGDLIQIEQALLNLGSNAADAMPEGGTLSISTANVSLDDEHIQEFFDLKPGRYVRLRVSDTGHGMEQKVLGHIFEPFYTTKEIGKGTGLGLASVYGIVKNHGGHIHCCSEVGKGTVFQIFLPAVDPRTQVAAVELQTHPQRGTETILVVDDEEAVRAFASQVLQRFGYTVLTAASGEDALKIYSNQTRAIDLVILDLGMPGMGGHRCLLELLQNDPAAGVVIASGYSMEREVKKTMEAGAKGFIPKPYYLGELLKKVRLFCDQKGNSGLMPEEYPGPKTNPEDFDS